MPATHVRGLDAIPSTQDRRLQFSHRSKDAQDRAMKTYYKTFLTEPFGGSEWAFIIIAIGTIDEDILASANERIQDRPCNKKRGA